MKNSYLFHKREYPQISIDIWREKYKVKDEFTIEDTLKRVHKTVFSEKEEMDITPLLYNHFVPAGRILNAIGSGRNTTAMNCLAGDVEILTLEHGAIPIASVANTTVTLLDGNGVWVPCYIYYHGEQETIETVFQGGHEAISIRSTFEHGWVRSGGKSIIKTKAFSAHGKVEIADLRPDKKIKEKNLYEQGIIHGLFYGDGSKATGCYSLQVCSHHESIIPLLTSFPFSNPPSCNGDPVYYIAYSKAWCDLKELPVVQNLDYLLGFVRGWFAADGCVSTQPEASICVGEKEEAWLRTWAPLIGWNFRGSTLLAKETNFGCRKKESRNLRIKSNSISVDDLLIKQHKTRWLINSSKRGLTWRARGNRGIVRIESVYCPVVSTTHSFALACGIHSANCFVMGQTPDTMEGIMESFTKSMLTLKAGGGIGIDLSTLRPKNSPLNSSENSVASGPISFAHIWDTGCKTIMSAGARRGAMMLGMRCDHPDIEEFVVAKKEKGVLTQFNISVLITDKFMDAVQNDKEWDLIFDNKIYKTISARSLWDLIMKTTYDYAEPGVLFIDTANKNNIVRGETLYVTNPCGEQYLPEWGACLLGAINIPALITNPFMPHAEVDFHLLRKAVNYGVNFLDRVIDISNYPLPEQEQEMKKKRRIGLGLMGVGSACAMLGINYKDIRQKVFPTLLTKFIHEAYKTSRELCNNVAFYTHPSFGAPLDRKNAMLTTIAPTGTTSILAKNVSGGIEPIFAPYYNRNVLQPDGTTESYIIEDYSYNLAKNMYINKDLSATKYKEIQEYFKYNTATNIHPHVHVKVQAFFQNYIDNSISKTINCPASISYKDFKSIYKIAYYLGCKGCTTYRPSEICLENRGAVLTSNEDSDRVDNGGVVADDTNIDIEKISNNVLENVFSFPQKRPKKLSGTTYKLKWGPDGDSNYYITINNYQNKPYEFFVNTSSARAIAELTALARMISAIWKQGIDSEFIIEELMRVHSPDGSYVDGVFYSSLPAAFGSIIATHSNIGDKNVVMFQNSIDSNNNNTTTTTTPLYNQCPQCSQYSLINVEGCNKCLNCGYSKC